MFGNFCDVDRTVYRFRTIRSARAVVMVFCVGLLFGCSTSSTTGTTVVKEKEIDCSDCVASATCDMEAENICVCPEGYEGDGTLSGSGCVDTNECALGGSECVAELGTCVNTDGGYECFCESGYEGDGMAGGTGCTDINECEAGGYCVDGLATCENTEGGYECTCKAGYEGDGLNEGTGCVGMNACEAGTDDCVDDLATCENTDGGYECVCEAGYEGDGMTGGTGCVDVNECEIGTEDCVDGVATCENTEGGYKCSCEAGYEGDGMTGGTGCVDINECATETDDCVADVTTCENTEGGHECTCEAGYEGDGFNEGTGCTDINECEAGTNDCVDGLTTCENTDGGYECSCDVGYEGDGLAAGTGCADINECEAGTADCVANPVGTCFNTGGSYICGCESGYQGDGYLGGTGCTDIDECTEELDDCVEQLGFCMNTDGGYDCTCEVGYTGDGLAAGTGCSDINECETGADDCVDGPAGVCTNTLGGYSCGCDAGYDGDGVIGGTGCTDVDECATGAANCVATASCGNTPGGFTCECETGYEGDGTSSGSGCTDLDECANGTDDCVDGPAGVCSNNIGSYSCGCDAGYVGDGLVGGTGCTDVDECASGEADCVALATCGNTVGGFICECAAGYEGDGTASGNGCTDLDECANGTDDCVDGPAGICLNSIGGFSCGCDAGYEGDGVIGGTGCVDIDECSLGTADCAASPGFCTNVDGGYICGCDPGYAGDGFETGAGCVDVDECAEGTDDCFDGTGICINTVGSYECICADGYEGDGLAVEAGGLGCVLQNPRLTMPRRMVNDKPLTLRAQILLDENRIDPTGCFSDLGTVTVTRVTDDEVIPITVTFFDDHLPVPDDSIRFYHGVGSVSFTLDDGAAVPAGDYLVTVEIDGLTARKVVTVMDNPTWRVMPASLAGENLVWGPDENIRISEHITQIPAGSTLTIHPGTLIMVDTTGGLEDGTLIDFYGNLEAVGTLGNPIAFFSEQGPAAMTHSVADSLSNVYAWRGINFYGGDSSVVKWVMLTGAGNGLVISHPRPPILNMRDTTSVLFEDCVITDATGMAFQTPGTGTYIIRRTLVSRVGIGGEFLSSGHTMLIEDSYWTGIGRGPKTPMRFDGDGIHIDGLYSDQTIRRCVVADIGDDGFDHSNSTFHIEDTIVHNVADKGCSMTAGLGTFVNVLMYDVGTGIRGNARVYDSTISASSPIAVPQIVESSIIWPSSIWTCSGDINYTLVGSPTDLACGEGNISVEPEFVDTDFCDFTLVEGSTAATAGPSGEAIGWMGYPDFAP